MSPYLDVSEDSWARITEDLISKFPTPTNEIVEIVLGSWESIFATKIGLSGFSIGVDIFPAPQIMGFFLHELIPLEFESRYPNVWSRDHSGYGKDIVCISEAQFGCEIKTSSHKSKIFGNRSHAQEGKSTKKDKSGYYLAVNFEKFGTDGGSLPKIRRIRFGWLDSLDWVGQTAATGQMASLSGAVERFKLKTLYNSLEVK